MAWPDRPHTESSAARSGGSSFAGLDDTFPIVRLCRSCSPRRQRRRAFGSKRQRDIQQRAWTNRSGRVTVPRRERKKHTMNSAFQYQRRLFTLVNQFSFGDDASWSAGPSECARAKRKPGIAAQIMRAGPGTAMIWTMNRKVERKSWMRAKNRSKGRRFTAGAGESGASNRRP